MILLSLPPDQLGLQGCSTPLGSKKFLKSSKIYCIKNVNTFVCVWFWGLNSGPTPSANLPALFLCGEFFQDKVLRTICPGWLRTAVLLISVSWVARTTGVSHHCLARMLTLLMHITNNLIHKMKDEKWKDYMFFVFVFTDKFLSLTNATRASTFPL
jgi:hypothetical protein